MFNKKASLEISIQAIVIVVLAMTLLGLGLGFIRGMFKNLSGTTEDVSEQTREQILTDIRTGDKKISFPKTELTIAKGEATVLNVGIKNQDNAPLYYNLEFCSISSPQSDGSIEGHACGDGPCCGDDNLHAEWFQVAAPPSGEWILDNAESDIRSVRVQIPKSAFSGSYAFTFNVVDTSDSSNYATKDFFIVVTG